MAPPCPLRRTRKLLGTCEHLGESHFITNTRIFLTETFYFSFLFFFFIHPSDNLMNIRFLEIFVTLSPFGLFSLGLFGCKIFGYSKWFLKATVEFYFTFTGKLRFTILRDFQLQYDEITESFLDLILANFFPLYNFQ